MLSYVDVNKIKNVHRDVHRQMILAQLSGTATTLAALEGTWGRELADFMVQRLVAGIQTVSWRILRRAVKKLNEAKNRYRFIA